DIVLSLTILFLVNKTEVNNKIIIINH
ncbi:hypothetical protein LCGC14_2083060, partial [marine sediment metagenome]